MKNRLQPLICLNLLLITACGRQEAPEGRAEDGAGPEITHSPRPPREALPDKKAESRAELARSETITDPEERDKVLAQVAWNSLEMDPELAREAFDRLTVDSAARIALIQHFAMRMADANPDEALLWAASLESEREAAAARVRIALVVADEDPARAAELLSEFGLSNREFEVAVVEVLQRWANKNPQDAAAWVVMFPQGEFRRAGVEAVVTSWLGNNPQAAFAWHAAIGDEQIRKTAGDTLEQKFLRQTPEVRESWLGYADPATREKLAEALLQTAE